MNLPRTALIALGLLLSATAVPLRAAGVCEVRLGEAETLYQEGKLAAAREAAAACLAGEPRREERISALALLARIALAEDDLAAARRLLGDLLRFEPVYEPDPVGDPPRYVRLVQQARREASATQVSSVSKSSESLVEAPATVVVLTAEEIERRGYRDLEEVLHDLPAFDISRSNGVTYSNLYQRGYRSDLTTRTLLLVDGVEENNLWAQYAPLSRQYSLSNVDRIEVVYGPSSTMYGANAFLGVIHVITREPEASIGEGRRTGGRLDVGGGSLGARWADGTLAGQAAGGNLSWSLTGRVYRSREADLTGDPSWDYDAGALRSWLAGRPDEAFHDALDLRGGNASRAALAQQLVEQNPAFRCDCSTLSICDFGILEVHCEDKEVSAVVLTPQGLNRARELDQQASYLVDGRPARFADSTAGWLVHGKLEISNLVLGLQVFRQAEGAAPWYTDRNAVGAAPLTWIDQQAWLSAKYSRVLRSSLTFSLFSRYRVHDLGNPSVGWFFRSYAGGGLTLADLAKDRVPSWKPTYYYVDNDQMHHEMSLVYRPSDAFTLTGGVEARSTLLQGNYLISEQPFPEESTPADPPLAGGNRFRVLDLGAYLQASYRLLPDLRIVAGGRIDDNRIRHSGGYGTVFNPRLAAVWSPGDLVFKAIYAEAFQDASAFQKYASTRLIEKNPGLNTEKVKSFELASSWQPRDGVRLEVAAYDARYSDVVQLRPCTGCLRSTASQFTGLGELRIRGAQADGSARLGRTTLFANYSYADPFNVALGRRVGDVASHQLHFGAGTEWGGRWTASLRMQAIGERKTGPGTDVDQNPYRSISPYTVAHLALTCRDVLPGTSLQLDVDNLFDREYFDPGIRTADGVFYAPRIPQPGRRIYLRAVYALDAGRPLP